MQFRSATADAEVVSAAYWGDNYNAPNMGMTRRVREKIAEFGSVKAGRLLVRLWADPQLPTAESLMEQVERILTREQLRELADATGFHYATRTSVALGAMYDRWGTPVALPDHNPWLPRYRAVAYGITVEEGVAILEKQGYACAICRRPFEEPKQVRMDHNHATGEFRGFLCSTCNTGLGFFGDSPGRLRAALAYLVERGHYGTEESP